MKRVLLALSVVTAMTSGAHGAVRDLNAGLVVTASAPNRYTAGIPFDVTGHVRAAVGLPVVFEAARGMPDQRVDIFVDDVAVASATTNGDGAYTATLSFPAAPPVTRSIRAVAFAGTPAETSSAPVQTTLDRRLIALTVSPSSTSVAQGGTVTLHAVGTWDDGRAEDLTERAAWTGSNEAVATVSNADGTRGVVTGVAPGEATISASLDEQVAAATVRVAG